MEINYARDLEHNYMALAITDAAQENYAARMPLSERVEGLLPFETRIVNGARWMYYRTDAVMSLTNRCLAKKLDEGELAALYQALRHAQEQLKEYLLDADSLYLSGDTVYYDQAREAFLFACYPYPHEDGSLETFAEELTRLTDETAVREAYRLYARVREGARLRELTRAAQPEERERRADDTITFRPSFPARKEIAMAPDVYDDHAYETCEIAPAREEAEGRGRLRIVAFLFVAVLLAGIYIRKEYLLSPVGNALSFLLIAISAAGAVGSFMMARVAKKKEETAQAIAPRALKNKKRRGETEIKSRKRTRTDWSPQTGIAYADLQAGERCEDARTAISYADLQTGMSRRQVVVPQVADADDDDDGAYTTLLTPQQRRREAKLYGRGGASRFRIGLDRLPMTLGKLTGRADFILSDDSVSRLHAHISKDEREQIYVRDLNSTNGTFRNGVRLKPNESVQIHPGDEVRFGDMAFEYV